MAAYNHDMIHCSQYTCAKKNKCYRYWLGENIKNTGFTLASYFYPKVPVVDGCKHFLDIRNY